MYREGPKTLKSLTMFGSAIYIFFLYDYILV